MEEYQTKPADTRIQDFTELYTFLYEKVDEYGGNNTSNIILILSESQHKDFKHL